MAQYKKQHYLPAVYLKNFCQDSQPGRKSLVWRFDGKTMRQVPVDSQCASEYFYSRERPEQVEKEFAVSENTYQDCVKLIKTNSPAEPRLYFSFILIMFDLHVRNAAYENQTGTEEYLAYGARLALLERELVLGRSEGELLEGEFVRHLQKYWRVRVLSPSNGSGLITSDNPSLLFALTKDRSQVEMAILPITPYHIAVAFDNRVVEVKGRQLVPDDEGFLNQLQMAHAVDCVYCDQHFDEKEQQFIAGFLNESAKTRAKIDEAAWNARVVRLPAYARLSFLSFRPPLL